LGFGVLSIFLSILFIKWNPAKGGERFTSLVCNFSITKTDEKSIFITDSHHPSKLIVPDSFFWVNLCSMISKGDL